MKVGGKNRPPSNPSFEKGDAVLCTAFHLCATLDSEYNVWHCNHVFGPAAVGKVIM